MPLAHPLDTQIAQALRNAQRLTLLDLAGWVEARFDLAAAPKVSKRTEANIVYSEILRRLGELQR